MPYANRETQRAYQREWWNRRRAEWVADNGPCVRCGSEDGLQVDHVDPRKKVSHKVWSWSQCRRETELAKCQVLCDACHHRKTGAENSRRPRPKVQSCPSLGYITRQALKRQAKRAAEKSAE